MIISTINSELPLNILSMEKGHGSFLTINLKSEQDTLMEYHIWVYLTDWHFLDLKNKKILLTCETVEEKHNEIFFKNKNVIEFLFSNKIKLILEANLDEYDMEDEMFFFF